MTFLPMKNVGNNDTNDRSQQHFANLRNTALCNVIEIPIFGYDLKSGSAERAKKSLYVRLDGYDRRARKLASYANRCQVDTLRKI